MGGGGGVSSALLLERAGTRTTAHCANFSPAHNPFSSGCQTKQRKNTLHRKKARNIVDLFSSLGPTIGLLVNVSGELEEASKNFSINSVQ